VSQIIKLTLGIAYCFSSAGAFAASALILPFPSIVLQNNERIVGFEVLIKGHVLGVDGVPQDWAVHISPEGGSRTVVSGIAGHGAAALLSAAELPQIKIAKPGSADGSPVEMSFHVTADFQKTRIIKITQKELRAK
jgi:hypothetical protein